MAGFSAPSSLSDVEFTKYLVKDIGIAVVPGVVSSMNLNGAPVTSASLLQKDSTLEIRLRPTAKDSRK
jgi:aspartate/methionine/tyrosine aminotransferase